MVFNVWTFLFQVVNFLVLVATPAMAALQARFARRSIGAARPTPRRRPTPRPARREAAALQAALTQQLADLDHRREAVGREARERAEAERQTLLADTEQAIQRRREEVELQFDARERRPCGRSAASWCTRRWSWPSGS